MKKNIALICLAVLALGLASCKEKTKSEVTETSDVNGVKVETTVKKETTTDNQGNTTTETDRKTTVDPEGMLNETTTEESHTEETHAE